MLSTLTASPDIGSEYMIVGFSAERHQVVCCRLIASSLHQREASLGVLESVGWEAANAVRREL